MHSKLHRYKIVALCGFIEVNFELNMFIHEISHKIDGFIGHSLLRGNSFFLLIFPWNRKMSNKMWLIGVPHANFPLIDVLYSAVKLVSC